MSETPLKFFDLDEQLVMPLGRDGAIIWVRNSIARDFLAGDTSEVAQLLRGNVVGVGALLPLVRASRELRHNVPAPPGGDGSRRLSDLRLSPALAHDFSRHAPAFFRPDRHQQAMLAGLLCALLPPACQALEAYAVAQALPDLPSDIGASFLATLLSLTQTSSASVSGVEAGMPTLDDVAKAIRVVSDVAVDDLALETRLVGDLGLDSLDLAEMAVELEQRLGGVTHVHIDATLADLTVRDVLMATAGRRT